MTALLLKFADFQLDEANARVLRGNGESIDLPPKAFAVLCELGRHYGCLVTKDQLLDSVWGHRFVSDSVLKTTISQIRTSLGDDAKNPRYVETVSRKGYRLIEQASEGESRTWGSLPQSEVPTVFSSPCSIDLVGREELLGEISKAWHSACNGSRQLVWVAGEAGVGKTTLVDSFVRQIDPVFVARGQCVEQTGAGEPYLPILEALAAQCEKDSGLRDLIRQVAPTWLMQLPWLVNEADRALLRQELVGASQDRMLRELGELLDRYTRISPFILVTEDIHWSDQATLHAMNHVARRRSSCRLLWIATFRLTEVVSDDNPLASLRREFRLHRLCNEVIVDSFSEREIAEYVVRRLPHIAISDTVVKTLYSFTDGLPLFLSNVLDDLISRGLDDETSNARQIETLISKVAVPDSLLDLIEGQISRLDGNLVRILEAGAVCGVEFSPSVVGEVLGIDPMSVVDLCERLSRQNRWVSPGNIERHPNGRLDAKFVFRHALYRRVFYERLNRLSRAELHRQVALILESRTPSTSPSEIAVHYDLGHDPMAALRYYLAATELALHNLAPADALQLSDRALAIVNDHEANMSLASEKLVLYALRGVSSAQSLGVSSDKTKAAFNKAESLLLEQLDHPMRNLILHGRGLVLFVRGEYAEADIVALRSFEYARQYDDNVLLVAACDLLGQMNTIKGNPDRALEYLRVGLSAVDDLGDEVLGAAYVVDPVVTMKAVCSIPLLHTGCVADAIKHLEEARTRADSLKQPMATMVSLWFTALFEIRRRNISKISDVAALLRRVVDESGLAQGEGPARWYQGFAIAHSGNPLEGHSLIRSGYEHNVSLGMYAGASEVLGYAAEVLLLAGDAQGAQRELNEAFELADRLGETAYMPQLLLIQSKIHRLCGDNESEESSLREALDIARNKKAPWLELQILTEAISALGSSPEWLAALKHAVERVDADDSPVFSRGLDLLRARN